MKVAYADPPYPGMAHRYKDEAEADGREAAEVDHVSLLAQLGDYDAWALSTSSVALSSVLNLCPSDVRIGAWVKPWASFKKGVNPAYAWEPVLFRGVRTWKERGGSDAITVRDWVSAAARQDGFFGAKPDGFCFWLFNLLGMEPTDELVDLFPGSGAVARAWNSWCSNQRLTFGGAA